MRQIEKEMLQAMLSREHYRKDNTEVFSDRTIYLHGNHIATVANNGTVTVNLYTLREWPTPTTKSRLRALGVPVATKDYVTYIDDISIYDLPGDRYDIPPDENYYNLRRIYGL